MDRMDRECGIGIDTVGCEEIVHIVHSVHAVHWAKNPGCRKTETPAYSPSVQPTRLGRAASVMMGTLAWAGLNCALVRVRKERIVSVELNQSIFREYDIRGIVGKDLDEGTMELLGRAYAAYLGDRKRFGAVVVGRDGRLSGADFSRALIKGLTAAGLNVVDVGEVPTGLLYFALNTLESIDGGMMLTASHNPKNYNGMKVAVGHGTIYGEAIQDFYRVASSGDFPVADTPGTCTAVDIEPAYVERVLGDIKLKRKLKVVIDAGNGVGGVVAIPLFEKMGCEVIPLHCEVDGNFPNHHPDPTKRENLDDIIETVLREKADVGIGFDGDVDRLGGCDEKGNMLCGDRLLALFARQILAELPGSVILGEVKCSRGLYEDVEKHGGTAIMWRTGHSHLKAAIKEKGAQLAGEMSGHIFFKHRWYGFDDAIYGAARLLEIVAADDKPLSAHLASIPQRPVTPEIEFICPDEKKFKVIEQATAFFQKQGYEVVTIDGARIEFPDGWGLLRASNTSPKLVMRVEADTEARVAEIRALIEAKVAELNR
jgi:phosphomannomutase / phosphoglucomutase